MIIRLPEKSALHRKAAFLVGAVAFLSFIYFYEGGGWNQNSRLDLLRAIVERHTLQIDAYHENTQDKAHFNGHYYSDKAPGLVFLAVPFAMVARPGLRAAGVDPASALGVIALSYVVSACAVALPMALAGVCLFFLGVRLGASAGGAAFGALVICLGTPMWAYASLFWAHALVGACLVFAFSAALKLRDEPECAWRFSMGAGRGTDGWMGDGHGVSGCSGLGDAGVFGAVGGLAAREWRAMAGIGGRGGWGGDLRRRVAGIFARGVWGVPSQLFVLRSQFVFVYAAAGVYGADVSASGSAAENFIRVFARAVLCFAGSTGGSVGIVVDGRANAPLAGLR